MTFQGVNNRFIERLQVFFTKKDKKRILSIMLPMSNIYL